MNEITLVQLDACGSTQVEALDRLATLRPGACVAVLAASQRDGRGRGGRSWQDPVGEALLLSIAVRGPMPPSTLHELPRRIVDALLDVLDVQTADAGFVRRVLAWKAPNDLVSAADGAKVAGVLVDARTVGEHVEHVVVGIGCNLGGEAFITGDGRSATSLAALLDGVRIDREALARNLAGRVGTLLVPPT